MRAGRGTGEENRSQQQHPDGKRGKGEGPGAVVAEHPSEGGLCGPLSLRKTNETTETKPVERSVRPEAEECWDADNDKWLCRREDGG